MSHCGEPNASFERRRRRASRWAAWLLLASASALATWAWQAQDSAAWLPWLMALSSCA